jgi:hypothetical protein
MRLLLPFECMALSRPAIAERLGLEGSQFSAWLASLDALGAPPGGLPLPRGAHAEQLLRQLGLEPPDLAEVMAHLPTPEEPLWWLLERAGHGVLLDVGRPDTQRPTPALPAELGTRGRLFWVFAYLAATPAIRAWHQQRGVADDISWATLADLGRHVALYRRRTGQTGLDTHWWLRLHWSGALFALGRLQFNPFRLCSGPAGPQFWYPAPEVARMGAAFAPGAPVLGVHIPDSGPLWPAQCDASFGAAVTFFAAHFPEHAAPLAVCTSWLLDDQLCEYLSPESNIIRFQRRFELVPGVHESDASAFHFVFGMTPAAAAQRAPRTTLERALLDHVAAGRHWNTRTGWLALPRSA